jgi:hypothetical protein
MHDVCFVKSLIGYTVGRPDQFHITSSSCNVLCYQVMALVTY